MYYLGDLLFIFYLNNVYSLIINVAQLNIMSLYYSLLYMDSLSFNFYLCKIYSFVDNLIQVSMFDFLYQDLFRESSYFYLSGMSIFFYDNIFLIAFIVFTIVVLVHSIHILKKQPDKKDYLIAFLYIPSCFLYVIAYFLPIYIYLFFYEFS